MTEVQTVNNSSPGKVLCDNLKKYSEAHPGEVKIHLVGHSAGSIVLSGLLKRLEDSGLKVDSMSFLAPAISINNYEMLTVPVIRRGGSSSIFIFTAFQTNLKSTMFRLSKALLTKAPSSTLSRGL